MLATALAALALAAPAAQPAFVPPDPSPSTVARSFVASITTTYGSSRLAWRLPDTTSLRLFDETGALVSRSVERGPLRVEGSIGDYLGYVLRNRYAAPPDGYSSELELPSVDYALGRARAGKRTFTPTTLDGVRVLKATYAVRANECAGAKAGRAELWIDAETLLPLRYREVRAGGTTQDIRVRYSSVNGTFRAGEFARPRVAREVDVDDVGFVRTSPAAADAALSYTPLLPTELPDGFVRAVTGWAKESQITGPEGSNPKYPELFAAVYRRGFERIEVTQRRADGAEWPADPFGGECAFVFFEQATVSGNPATYGTGPGFTPHLFWRDGDLLLTVSGPFAKGELVRIASSLAPVSAS